MNLRKIDALVAERMMGWTLRDGLWTGGYEEWRWRPTTDGNDMLRVVERMAKQHNCQLRAYGPLPSEYAGPHVAFLRGLTEWPGVAESLTLAVCLAALRVVLSAEEFAEVTR